MLKTPRNPRWIDYVREVRRNGYEIKKRLGGPAIVVKRGAPVTIENVFIVYFARRKRKKTRPVDAGPNYGYTKLQLDMMEFWRSLGFRVSRMDLG